MEKVTSTILDNLRAAIGDALRLLMDVAISIVQAVAAGIFLSKSRAPQAYNQPVLTEGGANMRTILSAIAMGVLSLGFLAGCAHHVQVDLVDTNGYHHQGYRDDHGDWHGGYTDENHQYHDDPHDWHN
jgi:hypothetical protein